MLTLPRLFVKARPCYNGRMLEQTTQSKGGWLDTVIKVLTIIKLLVQLAFYGILLGGTLWFLIKNPLPKMIEDIQAQVISSFMSGGK